MGSKFRPLSTRQYPRDAHQAGQHKQSSLTHPAAVAQGIAGLAYWNAWQQPRSEAQRRIAKAASQQRSSKFLLGVVTGNDRMASIVLRHFDLFVIYRHLPNVTSPG